MRFCFVSPSYSSPQELLTNFLYSAIYHLRNLAYFLWKRTKREGIGYLGVLAIITVFPLFIQLLLLTAAHIAWEWAHERFVAKREWHPSRSICCFLLPCARLGTSRHPRGKILSISHCLRKRWTGGFEEMEGREQFSCINTWNMNGPVFSGSIIMLAYLLRLAFLQATADGTVHGMIGYAKGKDEEKGVHT